MWLLKGCTSEESEDEVCRNRTESVDEKWEETQTDDSSRTSSGRN